MHHLCLLSYIREAHSSILQRHMVCSSSDAWHWVVQVILSSTELLLQAGSGEQSATTAAASSPSAAATTTPVEPGVFAAFRVGETTSLLRCSQLQRGWREPHSLVVRTAGDVASAGLTTRTDTLQDGTAAAAGFVARLQHAMVAEAAQGLPGDEGANVSRKIHDGTAGAQEGVLGPAPDPAAAPGFRLPPPSPATAAAYPLDAPPASDAGVKHARAAHRTRDKRPGGPDDSGRVLLQTRVHIASTSAVVAAGPDVCAPLLRATVTAVDFAGASPGLPDGPRSSSAAATPQLSETLEEDRGPLHRASKTPTSASVWLQQTGGVRRGGVLADVPWHLSIASIIAEVDSVDGAEGVKTAPDGVQDEPGTAVPAKRQVSTVRQLVKVGQVTAELITTAPRLPSPGQTSPSLLLHGELRTNECFN